MARLPNFGNLRYCGAIRTILGLSMAHRRFAVGDGLKTIADPWNARGRSANLANLAHESAKA